MKTPIIEHTGHFSCLVCKSIKQLRCVCSSKAYGALRCWFGYNQVISTVVWFLEYERDNAWRPIAQYGMRMQVSRSYTYNTAWASFSLLKTVFRNVTNMSSLELRCEDSPPCRCVNSMISSIVLITSGQVLNVTLKRSKNSKIYSPRWNCFVSFLLSQWVGYAMTHFGQPTWRR